MLKNIEEGTHKSAIGGYTKLTNNIGLKALFGFAMVGILPFGLEKIESLINPAHCMAYDSGMRTRYFVGAMFFVMSLLLRFGLVGKNRDAGNMEAAAKYKKIMSVVAAVIFVFTAICFVISTMSE